MMTTDIYTLGDQIAELTLKDAAMLATYLCDIHGIEPTRVCQTENHVINPPVTFFPAEFDLILESYDPTAKLVLIKTIRRCLDLGLKDAMDSLKKLPVTLKQGLDEIEAQALKQTFEEAGGVLAIR